MPEPLSPTIGFGMKVAVLPYVCATMCTVYLRICIQSARFTSVLNLVPIPVHGRDSWWPPPRLPVPRARARSRCEYPAEIVIGARENAALDRRAVGHVAALVFLSRRPRRLFRLDLDEAPGHVHAPGDRVENEELGFGTEISRVAQTRGFQVGLGALGKGPRIAIVSLPVGGFDHVAGDVEGSLVGERIDPRGIDRATATCQASMPFQPAIESGTLTVFRTCPA
jgi:hypothetical protein